MKYRVIGNKLAGVPSPYHNFSIGAVVEQKITPHDTDSAVFFDPLVENHMQLIYLVDVEPVELGQQEAQTIMNEKLRLARAALKETTDIADEHDLSFVLKLYTVDVSYSGRTWDCL